MARHQTTMRRLEHMSRLRDYRIERGGIDPRGWKVFNEDGRQVGVVRDLIIDTDRMTAAYVDVELDTRAFDLHDNPHVLVPLRHVHEHGRDRRVVVPQLTRSRVAAMYDARAEHDAAFWDDWWREDAVSKASAPAPSRLPDARSPPTSAGELGRALDDVPPDEEVRIPVVHEVVERRPVHPDARIAAREHDARVERRFDE